VKSLSIRVAFSAIDKLTRPVNAARQSAGGLSEALKKTQFAIKDLDSQSRTFNRLRDSVQKTSRQINEANSTLAGLNKAQREGTQLTDKQREHMAALAAKLERLNATRTQEMTKLRAASQALKSHGVSLAGSDQTIQSAIRRTEQYNQTLERQRQRLAAVTQARARHDRMTQAGSRLRGSGTMAVAGATMAGYAGGRFLAPALSFGKEMSRVQALTRIDKDSADFTALREQAKKLGAETAFTTTDAARGQSFLAMAGFTPASVRAALPGVLDMALAGDLDLGETADIGSNILSQFALDASEMDRVSNVLTGTFTRTNTNLRELGETMKYTGPVAKSMGYSLEEAATLTGALARMGIKGGDAGTALRRSLSRLAVQTPAGKKALKELGVEAVDSAGQMRKPFDLLLDLQQKMAKYTGPEKISFLKDIAGEQGFVGLQAIIEGAGDGYLRDLYEGISGAHKNKESQKAARTMTDNLSGTLMQLSSAWEGFRIAVSDTIDKPLQRLAQSLTSVITTMKGWVDKNPELTRMLMLFGGSAIALTAVIGGLSLAVGLLMGPFAKLQLGFALLTGGRGLGGAVTLFRSLGSASGSAMARVGGWSKVFTGLSGLTGMLAPLKGMLLSVFISPGAALGSLTRGIAGLVLRLTGLPAIWSMITGAVSVLGGALSFLLSPIGLIGVAFIAAGLLIWRFWQPIKAFFTGMFSGVMQQLAPFRDAFFTLTLVFSAIGQAVGRLWDWFIKLFTPVESSRESLDKCATAGETFGRVLGAALSALLWPLQKLMEGIGWILEKLDLIPSGLEAARIKAESLKKDPVMWEWDPQQKKMVKKGWGWSPKTEQKTGAVPSASPALMTGETGTQRRLQTIADNTGGLLDETKKRIGPGDIVFKNLPHALAVRGEWQEPRLATPASRAVISPAMVAASLPVRQAELLPVSRSVAGTPAAAAGFNGEIHIHLHGVERQDAREIGKIAAEAVSAELARRDRLSRGSFRDRD